MDELNSLQSIEEIEVAMDKAVRAADLANALGKQAEAVGHMATAERLAVMKNMVDAYGSESLLPDEAFEGRGPSQ